jgi:hypothetical protein
MARVGRRGEGEGGAVINSVELGRAYKTRPQASGVG